MTRLAQSQANYCAKVGHMVHSNRFAFQGGENLAEGGKRFPTKAVVNCWLNSHQGHREYLLSPRVEKAGVGIAKGHGKTFVAWAFSDSPPSYPDCPSLKHKRPKLFGLRIRRAGMKLNPIKVCVSIILGLLGLWGVVLGAHGIYVYFNTLSLVLGSQGQKLFLALDVPVRLRASVLWATERGVQSWIIPVLILVGGLWLLNYSRLWTFISNWLNKIRP